MNIKIIFILALAYFPAVNAVEVFYPPPDNPNKNEKYLFYLHGISVELNGPDSYSNAFNKTYEYTKIVMIFGVRVKTFHLINSEYLL